MENKSKPLEIKGIEGHIVLLCKGHYKYKDIVEALRMIWAIRCGYEYEFNKNGSADRYICNELFSLIQKLSPQKTPYYHEIIHAELENKWRYENLSALEQLMLVYWSELAFCKVKEKVGKKYVNLIVLPKPKKRIFNRILRGNGKYEDYKIINN